MSDTSLLFNLLGRDEVSQVFAKIRAEAVATSAVLANVGQRTGAMAQSSAADVRKLSLAFGAFGAAAAASSAVAGVALAGLPIIFGGLGALVLKDNAEIKASFTDLGHHVTSEMTKAAAPLVPVFKDVVEQLSFAFDDILPHVQTIFGAIGPMIGDTVSGITGLISNMMPGIVTAIQSSGTVVSALSGGLEALGTGLSTFFTGLSGGANGAAAGLFALLQGVGQLLGPIGALIGQLAAVGGPIMAVLMPLINLLVGQLVDELIPVIQKLGPVFVGVLQAMVPVADAIGGLFAAAGPAIIALFTDLGSALVQLAPLFVAMLNAVAPLIPAFINLLSPLTPLVPALAQIAAMFITGLAPILVQLMPIITQISALLFGLAAQVLMQLAAAIAPLLPQIGQFAMLLGQNLVTILTALAPMLVTVVGWFVQLLPVVAGLLPVITFFSQLIADNIGWLGPLAVGLIGVVLAFKAVSEAFNVMKVLMATNPWLLLIAAVVLLVMLIVQHWDSIKRYLGEAWNWIKDVSGNVWHSITSFIGDRVNDIKRTLDWFGGLGAMFDNWFSGAYHGAVNWLGGLLDWVGGLPGRILGALGNLGYLLVQAGSDIISGLWNGIKGMGSWLYDKILGFVKSNVPGPVLKFLGIASPSTLFADLGRWIPAGLAAGIDGAASLASDAATRMAGAVVVGMSGVSAPRVIAGRPGAGSGGADGFGGGGGGVHIEHFHAGGQSPYEIAHELSWAGKGGG